MILLIDNYDSFVFNLARYFERLGQRDARRAQRRDRRRPRSQRSRPQAIVLSPGPCTPNEAGCSLEVVRRLAGERADPGHLPGPSGDRRGASAAAVVRAAEPVHGRTSRDLSRRPGRLCRTAQSARRPAAIIRWSSSAATLPD